jgi:hypothetical protein
MSWSLQDSKLFSSFFGGLECVGHSFASVAHFVFLRDVWIRTQRAAVASKRATNLSPISLKPPISLISHPSPELKLEPCPNTVYYASVLLLYLDF